MSYPHFDLVQRAYNELIAEGKIRQRATQEEVEQDKGLLTRRAAWYAHSERNAKHGLLEKTEGNNSMGYSVDWILQQNDGVGYDIATDNAGMAAPVNGGPYPPDSSLIPRWRPPTAELAQVDTSGGGGGGGTDGGGDGGGSSDADLVAAIEANTEILITVAEQQYHLMTQGYWGECAMGLTMSYGMKPAPMGMASAIEARIHQHRVAFERRRRERLGQVWQANPKFVNK